MTSSSHCICVPLLPLLICVALQQCVHVEASRPRAAQQHSSRHGQGLGLEALRPLAKTLSADGAAVRKHVRARRPGEQISLVISGLSTVSSHKPNPAAADKKKSVIPHRTPSRSAATEAVAAVDAEVDAVVSEVVKDTPGGKYMFREWSKLLGVVKEVGFEELVWGTSADWMCFGVMLFLVLIFGPVSPRWKTFEQFRVVLSTIVLAAEQWFSGYLLELMLSFDNLFVFYLVFQRFRTPAHLQSFILACGIMSAMVFRAVFYLCLFGLMGTFTFVRVACGLMLLYSSTQILTDEDEEEFDAESSMSVRLVNFLCGQRLDPVYPDTGAFFSVDEERGTLRFTMMVFVVLVIELTDVAFAADSVSAKLAAVPDVYLNTSSTAMAMLSLRAVFFIMSDLIEAFEHVKYAVCAILVFVGGEVMISPWVHVPAHRSFLIILSIFVASVCYSAAWGTSSKPGNSSDSASVAGGSQKGSQAPSETSVLDR
eukprot:TRINITY_DN65789_c0_g1_i3.p1 TRINITY_DN65789_c0_g1~~TRINITY_DN65789_c0_g1_i3.p1  ORF type:complete len:483 (+),score=76.55 TRINITY_DN65789_c0_g1_i3:109-1557(+)